MSIPTQEAKNKIRPDLMRAWYRADDVRAALGSLGMKGAMEQWDKKDFTRELGRFHQNMAELQEIMKRVEKTAKEEGLIG